MKNRIKSIFFNNSYEYSENQKIGDSLVVSERFNYLIFLEKGSLSFEMLGIQHFLKDTGIVFFPSYIEVKNLKLKNAVFKIICFDNSFYEQRKLKNMYDMIQLIVDKNIYDFNPIFKLTTDKEKIIRIYFDIIQKIFTLIKIKAKYLIDIVITLLMDTLLKIDEVRLKTFNDIDVKQYIYRFIYIKNNDNNVFKVFADKYFLSISHIKNYCYAKNKKKQYFIVIKRG